LQENNQQIVNIPIKKPVEEVNNISELKSKMRNMNIDVKSENIKIDELEKENKKLKELLESENSKLSQIKEQIANEFSLLENKNNEYTNKINELEMKDIEITRKNNELKQQIIKHDYLFKSNYLQLEISDNYNSSYKWKLQKIISMKYKKAVVSSCSSGCHSCPIAKKEKRFS
jgi:chromosome segregation protein